MTSPRALGPSDVGALRRVPARFELRGRVLAVDAGHAVLGDALASVRVALGESSVAPGDLVRLDVRRLGDELAVARVVSRTAPALPERFASGETARLLGGVGRRLVARARAFDVIRTWFRRRRFVEVDTPALVPSPGLDLHLDAVEAGAGFLSTSPEYQMKRLLAGGLPRVFQLAHVFRAGERGSRHNPEFAMLEWYRAFASMDDVVSDTEALVREVARALGRGDALEVDGRRIALDRPFDRVSVLEAFERFAGTRPERTLELAETDEDAFFRVLVDVVEPALAREPRPVFVVDFPTSQASLARAKPGDPRVAERFELYVAGVELCNGFGELTDAREQRARFERDRRARAAAGKPVYPVDERFVEALEEGMPDAAGNALGVDRLVMLCTGASSIADVMPFPDDWV